MRNTAPVAMLAMLVASILPTAFAADTQWVGTWSAAPDSTGPSLKNQSVREIARLSAGGPSIRIRLSNLLGTQPVIIGPVRVAQHARGSAITPGSSHDVTFSGEPVVTIPKGESRLSDPIAFAVAPLTELAISLYLPSDTGQSTQHALGMQTAFITESGDATAAVNFPDDDVITSRPFVTDVEVSAGPQARTIVAFGDSITDAAGSTPDMNRRWPDVLADRLQADPALRLIAVINSGISGNRILRDKAGPSALARIDRDALDKAGARWVIFLEGINDIGFVGTSKLPADQVSADQIIGGMKTLIARTHQRGLKIAGATLTPFAGFDWPYHTIAGEAKRQAVNAWIRSGGAFDAIIDFDKAVRDPARPDHILPQYDADHIHPNDAGCKALADAVDLTVFAR